jgi:hypothetical protein
MGKQVRDNIHSFDLVNAFWQFLKIRESVKLQRFRSLILD